jgi:steroid delta-isomerase
MNTPSTPDLAGPVAKLVDYFQTITPESLAQLGQYYAASTYFKDPFHEVHDCQGIAQIFEHMFLALTEPRCLIWN